MSYNHGVALFGKTGFEFWVHGWLHVVKEWFNT